MCYVIDTRNLSKRALGPFTKEEAKRLAWDLNDFVRRNADITTNPFTVREG